MSDEPAYVQKKSLDYVTWCLKIPIQKISKKQVGFWYQLGNSFTIESLPKGLNQVVGRWENFANFANFETKFTSLST